MSAEIHATVSLKHGQALVFFISFCLMVIELVAGRIIAPYLGVSVYTWTSVIGTILVGISLGNYVGGVWADREHTRLRLGVCIVLSGVAALLMNVLSPVLGKALTGSQLILWESALLFSIILFFPLSFLLSTVSPQVVRFYIRDLDAVGRSVGSIGAYGALGSIVGTFLTGFVLISVLGIKLLLISVALALIVTGLAVSREFKLWKNRMSGAVALLIVGSFVMPSVCKMETNYYCIRISEVNDAAEPSFILKLDHLVHSYVHPDSPQELGYSYEKVYANLIDEKYPQRDASFRALFIGGGGYALPRYLESFFPNVEIVVSEIDPGVTLANFDYLKLDPKTRVQTINLDARMHLLRSDENRKFDLVFGDAFNDFSVPYHLTTEEFHRLLKTRMTPDGVYALNVIDDPEHGRFLSAMLRTLQSVWKYVYVAPQTHGLINERLTLVLLASDQALDLEKWNLEKDENVTYLLPDEQIEAFLASHPTPKLTDDFAPTDLYLAPVFRDAY